MLKSNTGLEFIFVDELGTASTDSRRRKKPLFHSRKTQSGITGINLIRAIRKYAAHVYETTVQGL
jgi:hypothetical protein